MQDECLDYLKKISQTCIVGLVLVNSAISFRGLCLNYVKKTGKTCDILSEVRQYVSRLAIIE